MAACPSSVPEASGETFMEPQLYRAAKMGQIDTLPRNILELQNLLTPNKNTVLHIHITSSTKDETEFVDKILETCPPLLTQANAYGELPMHLAARYGHARIVQRLIDHASDDLEGGRGMVKEMLRKLSGSGKDMALHEAVRFGHGSVVSILTKKDPDFRFPPNEAGETPLYLAAERGYYDLVKEMAANCSSLIATGPNGRTALHAAVMSKDKATIGMILENMAHLTKEADDKGCVPLHYAAEVETDCYIVRDLLDYDRNAAYRRDKQGRTALHIAASRGCIEVVSEIIQNCPDSCEIVDDRGWNVLHFAAKSQHTRVMEVILKESSLSNLVNMKDNEGNAPLDLVAASSVLQEFLSHGRIDKMTFKNLDNVTTSIHFWERIFMNVLGLRQGSEEPVRKRESDERENTKMEVNDPKKEKMASRDSIRQSVLVVAALIATVTFTAGFTLPGGYVADKGPLQGTAVLRKKAAFQAFIVTDTIALLLSSLAVIANLFLALQRGKMAVINLNHSIVLVSWAMILVVIAFITAIYAVLESSGGLIVAIFVISFCFFFADSVRVNLLLLVRCYFGEMS